MVKQTTMQHVADAIADEREYQIKKWGENKSQSIPGYLLIIQKELEEAINGWMKNNETPRNSSLEEVVQIAAVCIACLEEHGTKGNG